jgi:hypothetical protein
MHLSDLKNLHVTELVEMANANELENANRMRKQDLIFALLKIRRKKAKASMAKARWKCCPDGLRLPALAGHLLPRRARRHLREPRRRFAASICIPATR